MQNKTKTTALQFQDQKWWSAISLISQLQSHCQSQRQGGPNNILSLREFLPVLSFMLCAARGVQTNCFVKYPVRCCPSSFPNGTSLCSAALYCPNSVKELSLPESDGLDVLFLFINHRFGTSSKVIAFYLLLYLSHLQDLTVILMLSIKTS